MDTETVILRKKEVGNTQFELIERDLRENGTLYKEFSLIISNGNGNPKVISEKSPTTGKKAAVESLRQDYIRLFDKKVAQAIEEQREKERASIQQPSGPIDPIKASKRSVGKR
jgi:hypothetical protein